jgi:aspartate/methionine/tyrosine aminotransferase
VAPSFLPLAEPEDRLISCNSFSKAWLMTGWRLGWVVTPPALSADLGKLIEYNTSCAPDFIQRGALAALTQGEPFVARLRDGLLHKRDLLVEGLAALPGVQVTRPEGGMYAMFRIEGHDDSVALCKQLIAEAGLGLAPGAAFGPEGERWVRWCFAAEESALAEGLARLRSWIGQAGPG